MSTKSSIPLLTKRVYDNRLFSVDVSKKLRAGDKVTDFTDVISQALNTDSSPTNLAVSVPDGSDDQFEKITDGKIINFYCGGGQSGHKYEVSLRYVTTNETQLESVIRVEVV